MGDRVGGAVAVEDVYGYLQRESLGLTAWLALGVSWLAVALFFSPYHFRASFPWLPAVGLVMLASALTIGLHEHHYRLSAAALLASFILADGILLRAFHTGQVLYFAALVISLANYLLGLGPAGAVALAALALAALGVHSGLPLLDLVGPAALALLTLAVAGLSSRYLYMTLSWAWDNYVGSLKKVEEARQHRAQLASVSKSLEEAYRRLDRARDALAEAWQAAEEARRFKAQFAANISHELRTPLYIIVGFAETMLFAPESYGAELPAAYRSDLLEIHNSSQHLVGLVDDVLDLSQIEAGRMGLVKEPADVGEIVHEAARLLQGTIERKGLCLKVDLAEPLPTLNVDRTRIRQVLLNLLNNAARYTERGGITVEAGVNEHELLISVIDTGPGIPPEQLDKIFQSFYQVDASASRRHGGIGLGLAISRYFVEMHGGRIWAQSQPGEGSRFCFSLPLPKELQERDYSRTLLLRGAPVLQPPGRKQVLLMHPDATTAILLERHLDETQVIAACDAAAAEEKLKVVHPRAIIAGQNDGQALHLGERGSTGAASAGCPLITCPLPSGPLPALALGVRGYLVKPVTRKRLLATLEECAPTARRILVVDDDPRVVRLLSRMLLSARKYEIRRAFDGHQALALLRTEHPDLVLLDLYMPQMDGFSVLEHMARDGELSQVPVVVVSAKGLPEDGVLRLHGPITIQQPGGFTLAELFRYLQALLGASGPHMGDRSNGSGPRAASPA